MEDLLEMNTKERDRLKIMIRLEARTLTQKLAAEHLKISIRQVQRIYTNYLSKGEQGLISLRRGKESNNRLKNSVKEEIAKIIAENYLDFGPTLAQEKLVERHQLKISKSTIRNIMIEKKIWEPRKAKSSKVYKRREPKSCFGELIQMDGSYHDWFEGRADKCCLIVLIDDATSRLMYLQFVKWESSFAYFNALKFYVNKYEKPISIYTDRLAVFETTRKRDISYKETQFHRAVSSLGINLILARSPQAKGRVERTNGTLQDRLVKEMRLARISSMEEGNAFLDNYIQIHNKKFAKKPKSPINAHKSLDANLNAERILCLHFERKLTKDLLISFKGKTYQVLEEKYEHRLKGQMVKVIENENGRIELFHKDRLLKYKIYEEQTRETIKLKTNSIRSGHKPGEKWKLHPWKAWRGKQVAV